MTIGKRFALTCLSLAVAFGVNYSTPSVAGEHGHHGDPHWTYEGPEGPEHWGKLSKEWASCNSGKGQSPIDITGASEEDLVDIAFNYKATKATNVENNGHTVQVNFAKGNGNTIKVNGEEYELAQFHFHDPSEHTVAGKSFAMENHLVHKSADGKRLAVVGVLIEAGAENAAYNDIFAKMPKKAHEKADLGPAVDLLGLLPKGRLYYTYPGSLTTPPCSEVVTWLVLKSPIQLPQGRIDAFKGIVNHNARPVQPVNGRKIRADIK